MDEIIDSIINSKPIHLDDFSSESIVHIARSVRDAICTVDDFGYQDYGDDIFELAKRIAKARRQ